MRKLNHKLIWKGPEVVGQVCKNVGKAYTKFGLKVEANAKKKLRKGRGVRSGTLRRSIHLAKPGYDWSQDDVQPAPGTPELGNKAVEAEVTFGRVGLQVGSGLHYAMPVHQGHDGFAGYHYLTEALDETKPELPAILEEFKMKE